MAVLIGFLLARYREIFFAMLSLALSMILYGVLVESESLGSTDGFSVATPTFLGYAPHRDALGLRAVLAHARRRRHRRHAGRRLFPLGRRRAGGADPRQRNARRVSRRVSDQHHQYQVVIAGILGGLGGALAALAIGHVDPNMSYWTTSGGFVLVTILAGSGYVAAAFVGSLVFEAVRSFAFDVMPQLGR